MAKMQTAERVSRTDASDNYVFQRSILAYHYAARLVSGDVLEIGTGMGYGIDVVAPAAQRFTTIDKSEAYDATLPANAQFKQMQVPPIGFADESFDLALSLDVIVHFPRGKEWLPMQEMARDGSMTTMLQPVILQQDAPRFDVWPGPSQYLGFSLASSSQ